MKKIIVSLLAFICLSGISPVFSATLNFEDLGSNTSWPSNYNGFSFTAASPYEKPSVDSGNYRWDGTIGNYSVASTAFDPITIASSNVFSLDSFYVTTDADGYNIYYSGYLNNSLVASGQITATIHSNQYFVDLSSLSEWGAIDKINFSSSGTYSAHVCLDNITYSSVPIPAALWLLSSGLLGLLGYKKCRRA